MKKIKFKKSLAALLVFVVGAMNVMPVSAGLKTVVRNNGTVQTEIDQSAWHNANGDVTAENGVIVFPKESTADTKLITKTKARVNEGVENVALVQGTLQFTNLPKGEKFVIALGLKTIESELGEAGNLEIAFTNDGGLKASVTAYTKEGETVEVMAAKSCGSLGRSDVQILLTAHQMLTIKIGGKQICNTKVPVDGDGRIGFLQTGSCGVKISNINVTTWDYERPENCDIYETFDNGAFNKNLLTSKLIHASKSGYESFVGIGECNGNNAFYMLYPNLCYLGTRYKYSNFEMSFDVPYLQRSNEMDDSGKTVKFGTQQLIVSFGGEGVTYADYGHETAAERLLFRNISAITRKNGDTQSLQPHFPFFDPAYQDKGFSIKIRVVDSTVNIYMKWMEDTQWIEAMSYEMETPTGTIQIWGQDLCSYAIDNLKIVNLDVDPNLVEVDYASSVIEVPEDFDYQPMEMVYKEVETDEEEERTFSFYLLIPIVGVICISVLGTTALIVSKKKTKGKEGAEHEE